MHSFRAIPAICALALASCGDEAPVQATTGLLAVAPRPQDPRLASVRTALEAGDVARAREGLRQLDGFQAALLRARAELLAGDPVRALREIELARELSPDDGELWATEVEVLAALDRLEGAREALAEGLRRAGRIPALERARGVLELRTSGHAREALAALERARAGDPELCFLAWPLAQAHILVGRGLLGDSPGEALAHAECARALVPGSREARELEAEARAAVLDFEGALALYHELEREGMTFGDVPALLHQRCATKLLLERDRAGAIEHYLAARARGLDGEGLGFGQDLLREEARAARQHAAERLASEDWPEAAAGFTRALELDPADLEAAEGLAFARLQLQDYRGAAEAWEVVLERAPPGSPVLEDPVALYLASAWRLAGEARRAHAVLSAYLDREPEGEWSSQARELLEVLEAEELAARGDVQPRR